VSVILSARPASRRGPEFIALTFLPAQTRLASNGPAGSIQQGQGDLVVAMPLAIIPIAVMPIMVGIGFVPMILGIAPVRVRPLVIVERKFDVRIMYP